jgi:flagellar biosynthesis/type III secretory pathway chaperone
MIEKLEDLISALREELQQYGEMLARLDSHQDLVVRRQTNNLLQSVAEIESQGAVIQKAREVREHCRCELARALALPENSTFAEIGPLLPGDYRPLVSALVQENNELLLRIQQRSRQNHLLLARTLEMMQRFMSTLFPGNISPVYNGSGAVFGPVIPPRALYDAVG